MKGIPDFWFTVLNNIPIFWSMIQRHDCDPLKYLTNISSVITTHPEPGFTLQFHFAPNQYFTNEILTKQYKLEFSKKNNDPFNVYVPGMIYCIGCDINWKSQDLTVTIKKNKIIKRASFFNFFDPPKCTSEPNLEPYFSSYILTDYYLGSYLKESVIPKAILYYLGEAVLRENFGFEEDSAQKVDEDLTKNWLTTYRRQSIYNTQYEQDFQLWKNSEKLLAESLAKQNLEKAKDFEDSKVNLTNLFLLGVEAKEDQSKYFKSKFTEKLLADLVFSKKK
uniref:Nucleosome assembly protein 1-like protein 1 isoform x2 n=1 Tax=Triatoma infestans TaxID=30076 RepID=A0A170ZAL7_TRIIF